MNRSLVLLVVCPLFACASTPEAVSAPKPEDFDLFTYHVAVPSVEPEASQLVLRVATTEPFPTALAVHGLVGNAPFEVPPLREKDATRFSSEQVELEFRGVSGTWELQATTQGKPLELDIRVGYPKGSTDVAALERALVECTSGTCDGKPIEGLVTRLARAGTSVR